MRSRGGAGAGSPPEDWALAWLADNVIVFVQRQQLGEPEVGDLDMRLALYQDVPRCQVAVHAAAGAQVFHALQAYMGLDPRMCWQGASPHPDPDLESNPDLNPDPKPNPTPTLYSSPDLSPNSTSPPT